MKGSSTRRGQPVFVLAMLIGVWCGARGLMLTNETGAAVASSMHLASMAIPSANNPTPVSAKNLKVSPFGDEAKRTVHSSGSAPDRARLQQAWLASSHHASRALEGAQRPLDVAPLPVLDPLPELDKVPPPAPVAPTVRVVAGHQLLWLAAIGRMPLPVPGPKSVVASRTDSNASARWSADSWLLLRKGGSGLTAAGRSPSYGASQLGAVLRYRLTPGSTQRPTVYLRASAALDGSRQKDVAAGFSLRPLPRLPVTAALEGRLTSAGGGQRLRPAAMLVTELPPLRLPLDTRAEMYAQAGYVGGRDATAFADGQLRVDRKVARFKLGELRAGGGAWAGAQKGGSRIDVGPGLTLSGSVAESAAMRLSLDWRFRVAGKAAPTSGPALTLSAGF